MTKELQEDVFSTALEGGIGYWAEIDLDSVELSEERKPLSTKLWEAIQAGQKVSVLDADDPRGSDLPRTELGVISLETIKKGSALMRKDFRDDYNDLLDESYDAGTADIWMQLIVMGELTFA